MKKIEMLWSVALYPQKFKTMQFRRAYTADQRINFQFSNGAIAFVPIWPNEFYRAANLPYIEVSGIERTFDEGSWKERNPEKTYAVILPTKETPVMIYNETDELATLTEFFPENETTWRNNNG